MKTHRYISGIIAVAIFGLFLASCSNPTQAEPTLSGAVLNGFLAAQLAPLNIPLPAEGVFNDGDEYTRAEIMTRMTLFLEDEELPIPPEMPMPVILEMISVALDGLFAAN